MQPKDNRVLDAAYIPECTEADIKKKRAVNEDTYVFTKGHLDAHPSRKSLN